MSLNLSIAFAGLFLCIAGVPIVICCCRDMRSNTEDPSWSRGIYSNIAKHLFQHYLLICR